MSRNRICTASAMAWPEGQLKGLHRPLYRLNGCSGLGRALREKNLWAPALTVG
jgi:hypothetical protein